MSNTRRSWNIFPLPEGVESSCNVGCCGIDGCTSALIGASLIRPDRLFYGVLGDLTFFYDLNVIGNRHVGNNVRIMLINNGRGAEFRLSIHYCAAFGQEADKYMAAAGHFGNQSPLLVKHFVEDLGYQYLSATTKEEYMKALKVFTNPQITDKPMIFEVFTQHENESEALNIMTYLDEKAATRRKVVDAVKSVTGEKGLNKLRKIFK